MNTQIFYHLEIDLDYFNEVEKMVRGKMCQAKAIK